MKQFYVYVHCRPDGTPFYVGKGLKGRERVFNRRTSYHKNIVAKHGRENIKIKMYACPSEEAAFEKEARLIARYRKIGYSLANLTDGGDGPVGMTHSEEAKLKMSADRKGRTQSEEHRAAVSAAKLKYWATIPKSKRKMSNEARAKMSKSQTGRKHSKETLAKMSVSSKAGHAKCYSSGQRGRKHTPETKAKLSSANAGRKHSAETKLKMSISHYLRRKGVPNANA